METIKHTYKGFECEIILTERLDDDRRKVIITIKTRRGTWMSELIVSDELIDFEPNVKDYLCQEAMNMYEGKVGHEPVPA